MPIFGKTKKTKALRLLKIKFLLKTLMLTHRFQLFTMNKSCPYATAAINACDRIYELEKQYESYPMVNQGQREPFINFLQILIKAIQIGVIDPDAR